MPKKTFDLGLGSPLLLCGWAEARASLGTSFSEFELVDSRTGEVVFRVDAMQYMTVEQTDSTIHVTEYRSYPLGADFNFIDVPYRRFVLQKDGERISTSCALVLRKPSFTPSQLERLDAMYQKAAEARPDSEALGVLVVLAAMGGNAVYKQRLTTAPRDLRLDGSSSEEFHAAVNDLEEFQSGKCRRDFDPRRSARLGGALHDEALRLPWHSPFPSFLVAFSH